MTSSDIPSSFGAVAPYYDELMRAVPYRMWVGYYQLLLAHQDKDPKRILDVCCGTGTMCELLVQEGKQMSGLDLSAGMIEAARNKADAKNLDIRYEVADASNFNMGETYEAALSFFDSLNNILNPDDLRSAFKCAYDHLEPGGSWIFDLNTAYAFREQLFDQQNLKPTARLRYKWVGNWNEQEREITVNMKFWFKDQEFTEVHRQHAYEEEEVRDMLQSVGFEQVRTFHSYTLNPPRFSSDRIHYSTIKPEN